MVWCTGPGEEDFVFRDIIGVVRVVQGQVDQQILSMPAAKPMTNVTEDMVIPGTVMKCLRGAYSLIGTDIQEWVEMPHYFLDFSR